MLSLNKRAVSAVRQYSLNYKANRPTKNLTNVSSLEMSENETFNKS